MTRGPVWIAEARLRAQLSGWAAEAGGAVVRVKAEVGLGMKGSRDEVRRVLADPRVAAVVVEHRDV